MSFVKLYQVFNVFKMFLKHLLEVLR